MTWLSESGYRVFNPERFRFPSPQVPILPTRIALECNKSGSGDYVPVTDSRNYQFFSWGRYALLEAFRLSGVGPEASVLIPAYHCRTMLDPALSLGGEIGLYPVDAELKPDVEAIERTICESRVPVRALVATHYFGFPQSFDRLKALCDRHGIVLIEDCSHTYIRSRDDHKTGTQGRFVVASPYKFCPTMDGGVLFANGQGLNRSLQGRRLADEVSAAIRLVQRARAPRRLLAASAATLEQVTEQETDHFREDGHAISPAYDHASISLRGFRLSQWIVCRSNADRIARRRRDNYATWLAGVANMNNCRALYPVLPDGVAPYMFPLVLERPLPDFYDLKRLGVPIWRWDSMGVSDCAAAMDYRLRLIHLPCHQDIGAQEMDWMLTMLKQVVNRTK